jgi:molybdenum cofactor cytidylyltransferase
MIAAIVLAAGQSRRMGRNKLLLPFGRSTVIETIVAEVQASEVGDIVVVTGHERAQIEARLATYPVCCIFNSDYARVEMLTSIQVGLRALAENVEAALIVLGDQPRIQRDVVRRVIGAYRPGALIVPSFEHRRGHPILLDRSIWPDVLASPAEATLRAVINARAECIRYVEVESDSVLRDIDTPEDYEQAMRE